MSENNSDADVDEVKRKFREALEKKNQHHREGEAHLDGESIVSDQATPAAAKREFRPRKTG